VADGAASKVASKFMLSREEAEKRGVSLIFNLMVTDERKLNLCP